MNRVLVVEDEDDVRELLKTILTGNGFEVFTASSGEEALVKVGEVEPDLVVLDLVLPGLSGLEVCRLLKNKESTRCVKVLFVSALDRDVDLRYAFEAECDGYLAKPFTVAELLLSVDRVLAGEKFLKLSEAAE